MVVQMSSKRSKQVTENGAVKKKALLVAQEISFAKVLAGNDKKLRDRGVKRLRKWLTSRARSDNEFNDDDFLRIWKGLFYCVWMADKPLIQEELCDTVSSLILCFDKPTQAFSFMKAFFLTMASEWNGIDQHRLNKFLMLIRRFLRQCLLYVHLQGWSEECVDKLDTLLNHTYFPDNTVQVKRKIPGGLVLHFCDIFLEELAKVTKGDVSEHALLALVRRFALFIAVCPDRHISDAVCNSIFDRLIEQSPEGIEYSEKFTAWKKLGFPGDNLNCMERVEESDEEVVNEADDDDELENLEGFGKALDPRAGKVDVLLPVIAFNAKNVEETIKGCQFKKFTTTVTRKILGRLARKFGRLAKGNYPLGYYRVPKVPDNDIDFEAMTIEATESLQKLKEELLKESYVPMKEKDNQDISSNTEPLEKTEELVAAENCTEKSELPNGWRRSKKRATLPENNMKLSKLSEGTQFVTPAGPKASAESTNLPLKKKSKVTVNESGPAKHKPQISVTTGVNSAQNQFKSSEQQKLNSPLCEVIATPLKRSTESRADKVASKKGRLSLDSSGVSSNKFVVSELPLNNSPPLAVHLKRSKVSRRASLPAKIVSESSEESNVVIQTKFLSDAKPEKIKRKQDSWNVPSQEGETEIIITRDMLRAKRKSLSKLNDSASDQILASSPAIATGSSSKKVNFVLQRNRAQGTSEYLQTLRENPEIPYDAKKKPSHGVLKASPHSSPINPFYLRKIKLFQNK